MGPLTIRLGYLPRLTPWLLRFMANTTPRRVEEISRALSTIVLPGLQYYRDLLDDVPRGARCRSASRAVCTSTPMRPTPPPAKADNATRLLRGVALEILGPDEVRQLVPAIGPDVAGGALATQSGHTTSPLALSQLLAARIVADGGTFVRAKATGFAIGESGPTHVAYGSG